METTTKVRYDIAKIKAEIKGISSNQKVYKNQRRTEKIEGERTMPAYKASGLHIINRDDLRFMYAAYGFARGRSFNQTENCYPEKNHPLNRFKMGIERYLMGFVMPEEVIEEVEVVEAD
jgi:hypothetical protein